MTLSNLTNKHLILFGFKHVGKTVIGKRLATLLQKKFIDLDNMLEKYYARQHAKFLTCRQIMQSQGEYYYRKQERLVLHQILQLRSAVIALGGGTVLAKNNQQAIKAHFLLHIIASPRLVFERIMASGHPAFYDPNKTPYESFIRLWEERSVIYKSLTPYRIDNSTSLDTAIHQARVYFENNEKIT